MEKDTIVLYPAPGIGHVVSMVELAKIFQTHHYSITIILSNGFLDHPSIEDYINRISTSNPSIFFHRLPHTAPTTASFSAKAFDFIKRNTPNVATTLTQISKSTTIKAFVMDLFCFSAMEAASSMGIPVYYFFASGAACLAILSYLPKLHEETNVSFKDMVGVELRVPGNAPLKAVKMPQPMLDREDPAYWEMLHMSRNLCEVSGIMVNTFPELEPLAVKAFAEGACFPQPKASPPLYYIGPLIAEPQQSGLFLFLE